MNPSRIRVAGFSRAWTPLLLLLVCASPLSAQSLTMSATLELSQVYLPHRWQPVRLEFRNESDRNVDGSAQLRLDDATSPAVMKLPVQVPPHSRVTATMWAYFPLAGQNSKQKKQGQTPPLGMVEWRGSDGALLSRSPILGFPLRGSAAEEGDEEHSGKMILAVNEHPDQAGEVDDVASLVNQLKESTRVPLTTCVAPPQALPREPYGLRSLQAIVLQDIDPQAFDLAQREALLNYVRGGGVLVVAAPREGLIAPGSWLEGCFPVRVIGSRLVDHVGTADHALKFAAPLQIAEAVDAGGESILRDRDYIHVAIKPLGLGAVIFTGFSINALDPSQPAVASLWQRLLRLDRAGSDWADSQLGGERREVLAAMIGKKVAPWSVAAAVVIGYLLVLVAIQLAWPGASRPRAFVVSVAAAVVLSGVLVAMGLGRRANQTLQSARLSVLEVSSDGGGWKQESLAYVGPADSDIAITSSDGRAMIRPAFADRSDPPTILQQPFRVENPGVLTERIGRVWEQEGPLDQHLHLRVVGRFAADGLTVDVDNGLGQPLRAPLVLFGRRALTLPDLQPGQSSVQPVRINQREDFTNSTMITSDLAKRREQVVRASLVSSSEIRSASHALLVGWLDENGAMVMVRTPLQLEPPPPNTRLKIASAMIAVDTGRLPYDAPKSETVPSTESGQWVIKFSPPASLGALRPTRVTFETRITLPEQTLVLRKDNSSGDVVAEWTHEMGSKQVSFDCGAEDRDTNGRVSLSLEIRSDGGGGGGGGGAASGAASGASAPWQIKDLGMSFDDAQTVASDSQENH